MKPDVKAINLDFSDKYQEQHSKKYFDKYEQKFWRRLSNRRDQAIVRQALELAGNPESVLDVPCGTGRFWQALSEQPNRKIYACDNSQDMIDTGFKYRPDQITQRVQAQQGSAFDLAYDDGFVDCVFCIRLIHHVGDEKDRLKLLSELRRVASSTVIISLWVDGNFQAWKRKKHEQTRKQRQYQNRFVISTQKIEQEFKQVGLEINTKLDFFKYYSMWRTYVLNKV